MKKAGLFLPSSIIARQLIFYFAVGITGLLLDSLFFYVFRSVLSLEVVWANIIARHCGALYTFVLNKTLTFQSGFERGREPFYQLAKYIVLLYFSIFLSTTLLTLLIHFLQVEKIAMETVFKLGIDLACAIVNFMICKYLIFRG